MTGLVLAFGLTMSGVFCLYASWRRLSFFNPLGKYLGWLLLLVACFTWSASSNVELGISYAMLAIAVCAWLLVMFNYEWRAGKERKLAKAELVLPRAATLLRHGLMFLAAVPLAGVMAAYVSTALSTLLPWQLGNALVFAMLLMPLIWGAAAYWSLADPQLTRPCLSMSLLLGISLLLLYM